MHRLSTWSLALGALSLGACQVSPPERQPLLPAPTARQLSSFRLNPQETGVVPEGVPLVGEFTVSTDSSGRTVGLSAGEELTLDDLLLSVEDRFPLILAALEEFSIAEGEVLASQGGFDTKVKTDGFFGTQGFYENEQVKLVIEQPTTAWGATFFGGYKLGTGD
ncbi:MAG: hypothetical protein AAF368_17495, partial [Planctomycetota bacterium]